MSDFDNLKIVHWNVCGVRHKRRHLQSLLLAKHIDVALISETKLRDNVGLRLEGYCVYRQDKLSATGKACHGLLVAVKQTISHTPLPRLSLTSMDALGIQLERFDRMPLRIYAVYKPPATRLRTSDIDALLQSNCPTIAAGDMNAKHFAWNSVNLNTSGRILYKHSVRQFSVAGPSAYTYYPRRTGHRKNVLDIIMFRGLPSHRRPWQAVYEERFGSDHCPVFVTY